MPRLTENYATTIVVPQGRRDVFVFDTAHRDAIAGFFFRKFADTDRTFAGVKFTANGKQRRLSLGEVTQGTVGTYRKLAAEAKARARLGQDVLAERQQARAATKAAVQTNPRYTFSAAVSEYLLARERGIGFKRPLRSGSLTEVTRHLRKHCTPLHQRELSSIRREDIVGLLDSIAANNGRIAADRTRASISTMFGWALDRGTVQTHPATRVRSYGEAENYRALTEPELAEVWHAVAGPDTYGALVRFLILTALRYSNAALLEWNEVDLAARELRIPGSRMKNRLDFVLPLSDQATAILKAQPRKGQWVFTGEEGEPIGGLTKRKAALDRRINENRSAPIPHWVLHSFRATFATIASNHDLAPPHILVLKFSWLVR